MYKQIIINNKKTNYSVNEEGIIINNISGKILKQRLQQGYKHVGLHIEHKNRSFRVHRLVAEAFIKNPNNYPYVNHKDGNRQNNNVSNLEWCTPSQNSLHSSKINKQRFFTKRVKQYNMNGEFMLEYNSIKEAALETNTNPEKISEVYNRHRLSTNNYQWRFSDDEQDVLIQYNAPTLKKKVGQYLNGKLINTYDSFSQAARAIGGDEGAISRICSGVNKTHHGFEWKLVEDIVQELK